MILNTLFDTNFWKKLLWRYFRKFLKIFKSRLDYYYLDNFHLYILSSGNPTCVVNQSSFSEYKYTKYTWCYLQVISAFWSFSDYEVQIIFPSAPSFIRFSNMTWSGCFCTWIWGRMHHEHVCEVTCAINWNTTARWTHLDTMQTLLTLPLPQSYYERHAIKHFQ